MRDQSAERGSGLVGDNKTRGIEEVDHSLKGLDWLRRKVAVEVAHGADVDRVLGRINDLNRYTLTFEPGNYTQATQETYARLKDLGYEPMPGTEKNTWQDPVYQGINTTWQHQESGQKFELQFHTPDSFQVKTDNHELYELARSGHFEQISAGDPDRAKQYHQASDLLQNERYQNVVVPPGNEVVGEQKIHVVLNPKVATERVQEVRKMEADLKDQNAKQAAGPTVPQQGTTTAQIQNTTQAQQKTQATAQSTSPPLAKAAALTSRGRAGTGTANQGSQTTGNTQQGPAVTPARPQIPQPPKLQGPSR
ncbi:hypothetical protein I3F58_11780 [Streptomyces sp. MUM 203J]|uniref:hypothetical protein n=1 Tax=Streptomyces sp. MUM 203J TaxID=2791990 RepID=UPI001F04969B|nr:hypothetical protein [Streptomyces sp. MUM 203J]MCH0540238.1 hypothetical protein [Streptomyces sp. MUM 203J]